MFARALPLTLLLSFTSCALPIDQHERNRSKPIQRTEVQDLLDLQAADWNRGDLAAFVEGYAKEEELTFFGSRGLVHGRDELLKSYEAGYPDAASRGKLSFEIVEFRPLGRTHAMIVGNFRLERDEPSSGTFTLILTRESDGEVRIVHDHTS